MATQYEAHARAIGGDGTEADGINHALAAGFDPGKLLALLAKWGPDGAAMLADAVALFGAFSWQALLAFFAKHGGKAASFFQDVITLFGQPAAI